MDKLESNCLSLGRISAGPGRWIAAAALACTLIPTTGCRICADCEDLAYPAYGGVWQRTRRDAGRVGSVFDPAGALAFDLVSRDAPVDTDVLERQRYKDDEYLDDPDRESDLRDEEQDRERGDDDAQDRSKDERSLRDSDLEDIEDPDQPELEKGSLEDINVRIIPRGELNMQRLKDDVDVRIIRGTPMPPVLN